MRRRRKEETKANSSQRQCSEAGLGYLCRLNRERKSRWIRTIATAISNTRPIRPVSAVNSMILPRPLQSGRSQPIAHTRSCFRLPCATQQQLPLHPWRQVSCRIFEAHGFFRKSFFEGLLMLDTAALCHALLPFQWRKAEVQQAISSPIVATFRAVTDGHFTQIWRARQRFILLPRRNLFKIAQAAQNDQRTGLSAKYPVVTARGNFRRSLS